MIETNMPIVHQACGSDGINKQTYLWNRFIHGLPNEGTFMAIDKEV